MKKILLVSGCSNTEKDFYSEIHPEMDCSWPKWPELLANKLDMDCVNLAKSGSGNEFIYSSLLDYITRWNTLSENNRKEIGLVIPAWTQCQRKDYQKGRAGRWTNVRIDPNGDVFSWMRRTLDNYLSFQILCEHYNLDYRHAQMLSPYQDWMNGLRPRDLDTTYPKGFRHKYPGDNPEEDTKIIYNIINSYEDKINTNKFIGWPLSKGLGGFSLQKELIGWNNEEQRLKYNPVPQFRQFDPPTQISEIDHHPNALGQEKIAEFIYERL